MSTSDLVVVTTAQAKPGKEDEVVGALRDVAEAARAQSGCVDQRIFRSPEDPSISINVERWASDEAREAFLTGPAVQKFGATVSDAFASPPQPVKYEAMD